MLQSLVIFGFSGVFQLLRFWIDIFCSCNSFVAKLCLLDWSLAFYVTKNSCFWSFAFPDLTNIVLGNTNATFTEFVKSKKYRHWYRFQYIPVSFLPYYLVWKRFCCILTRFLPVWRNCTYNTNVEWPEQLILLGFINYVLFCFSK